MKDVALLLKQRKKLLVMFDELFKGTNVKDAYDCSKVVNVGFQQHTKSLFIISSHLAELAHELSPYATVAFRYFESTVKEGRPVFSYRLAEGVSTQRLGLLILQNEDIEGLLKEA